MVEYQKYINALRKCAKEHENDRTSTGHIIVSDLCKDTANLLEELEQESKWIPVSERLPEGLFVKTLVRCEDDNGLPISPMVALYDGFNKFWICAYKVTAWMPLPEPYKAERNDKE